MEHIDLKDFDIMGIFTLKDVAGIEKYVTEVSGNEYLSRSFLTFDRPFFNAGLQRLLLL